MVIGGKCESGGEGGYSPLPQEQLMMNKCARNRDSTQWGVRRQRKSPSAEMTTREGVARRLIVSPPRLKGEEFVYDENPPVRAEA